MSLVVNAHRCVCCNRTDAHVVFFSVQYPFDEREVKQQLVTPPYARKRLVFHRLQSSLSYLSHACRSHTHPLIVMFFVVEFA
jgi:hypothetical protein